MGSSIEDQHLSFADRLIAHRGYAARFPENTLLAIERALHQGARYIEIDLQLSADLQPVLYHDRDMQRLSGINNTIQSLTYDQLEQYRLYNPAMFGDRFDDEPIAHLQQLISLIRLYPQTTWFIEFKRVALEAFGVQAFLDAVLPLLEPVGGQVVLISYSEGLVCEASAQGWSVGLVKNQLPEPHWQQRLGINPDYLFLNYIALQGQVLQQHRRNWKPVQVAVFEVADPEQARQFMLSGVDLVETFSIAMMRQQLGSAG
ncbi:glycerophosphodiester phosphodiesterase family protein [Amphritea sp. HPY]|uniref:glycerophosphodiester phosphodiesterase family protein n=1 Tax=Amphritea sp. HPY TaxID=3421652 RepID=UPI003D7EDC14